MFRPSWFLRALAACLLVPWLPGLAAPAHAQALEDVVRIDVLDGGATDRGTHMAALRFALAPGWKTYWRSPGDAGIPPLFDWTGGRNVGAVALTWPTPHVFDLNGMTSVGYTGALILPVEITPRKPGEPLRLSGTAEIGVCREVCLPATLTFDRTLDPVAPRNPAIVAARAQRPWSASEAGVRAAECSLVPARDGMQLEARIVMPSAGGAEHTVIEPGDPRVWASEARTERRGDTLTARVDLVHVDRGPFAVDRSRVRITVLGTSHAVDIRGCEAG